MRSLLRPRRLAPALALLAVGMFAPALFAQIRFNPNPGGSMPNGPGQPNFPNNPFPNNPPNMPQFNQPNIPGLNPPHFPGLRQNQEVWYCEGCGRELSRGPIPPLGMKCPGCGAIIRGADFDNGIHIGPTNPPGFTPPGGGFVPPGGGFVPPGGGFVPPAGSGPAPAAPINNPAAPVNNPAPPAPMNPPPAVDAPGGPILPYSSPSTSSPSLWSNNFGTIVLGVVVLVIGVVILGGAACLILYSVTKSSGSSRRRRRPRFHIDDD